MIKLIDFIGPEVSLRYKEKSRFQSSLGAFISIIIVITSIILFIMFGDPIL